MHQVVYEDVSVTLTFLLKLMFKNDLKPDFESVMHIVYRLRLITFQCFAAAVWLTSAL